MFNSWRKKFQNKQPIIWVYILCLLAIIVFWLASTNKLDPQAHAEPLKIGSAHYCARTPRFVNKFGLQQPVAIDTQQSKVVGLVMRELRGKKRVFQHPSWRQTGHVTSTVRDAEGNIYVIPVPSVSLETNPLEHRNKVYKVNAINGEMKIFASLPLPESGGLLNPFGTMGLALDCDTNSLYVSSVAGSTPKQQLGVIYQLDLQSGDVLDQLNNVDAIGLGIFNFFDQKRLYYGSARSSNLNSIGLTTRGGFKRNQKEAAHRYELSLLGVKNGDTTQIRKVVIYKTKDHQYGMDLTETEFGFRLGADTSRRYKHYLFKLDLNQRSWVYQKSRY